MLKISYRQLKENYNYHRPHPLPPPAFQMDYTHNSRWVPGMRGHINTCAVRLSDALTRVDPHFFDGLKVGPEWHEPYKSGGRSLLLKASDVAAALRARLGKPELVVNRASIKHRRGIIFFDTIPGHYVTGHISLWDGMNGGVQDGENQWFGHSPRVYFWELQ